MRRLSKITPSVEVPLAGTQQSIPAGLTFTVPLNPSQNCLREIRSSLEKRKPLVLVQEADPAKGGGTIKAARSIR